MREAGSYIARNIASARSQSISMSTLHRYGGLDVSSHLPESAKKCEVPPAW